MRNFKLPKLNCFGLVAYVHDSTFLLGKIQGSLRLGFTTMHVAKGCKTNWTKTETSTKNGGSARQVQAKNSEFTVTRTDNYLTSCCYLTIFISI